MCINATMFENHRKSRILQHCERSELRLHSGLKFIKITKNGRFGHQNSSVTFGVIFKLFLGTSCLGYFTLENLNLISFCFKFQLGRRRLPG